MIPTSARSVCLALGLAVAGLVSAQTPTPKIEFPEASPAATVKQRVGVTDITVDYHRPSRKGRKIFGGLEPYGEVWRTGANQATKITFTSAVKFGGQEVPAGTYGLFSLLGEKEWTIILNQASTIWGAYAYDAKNDVARVTVTPMKTTHPTETLTIGFADLKAGAATLTIAWENVQVAVEISVDVASVLVPQIEAFVASEAKKDAGFNFSAAMFYYENDLDIDQALKFMDAGLAEQPKAYWMIYRKGLLLEKKGDKAAAAAAANESLALVKADDKAPASLKDEYIRLNEALLARVK